MSKYDVQGELSRAGKPATAAPYARRIEPPGPGDKTDQLAEQISHAENRQEALLDEGLEESFPASDPLSVEHIT